MKLNLRSQSAIYLSIAEEYKRYMELGVLQYDEKLPSVRSLATDLGINPNTVDRAYQELESQGFITTIPKKGSFVSYQKSKPEDKDLTYKKQIKLWKESNVSKQRLLDMIEEVYQGGKHHD